MSYNTCVCGAAKASHAAVCRRCRIEGHFRARLDITEAEVAWVAGIVEGEGCFSTNGREWWLAVKMTDEDIIERLHAVTGVGTVGSDARQASHHKIPYRWIVAGQREREWLASLILPWMGERRSERIRQLMRTEHGSAVRLASNQKVAGSIPVVRSV